MTDARPEAAALFVAVDVQYRRELPPLRAVIPTSSRLALVVVDGYVDLDAAGRPGLGAHVQAEFGVPVVGIAKTAFATATHAARVRRGQSSRPLYVTAAGMPVPPCFLEDPIPAQDGP